MRKVLVKLLAAAILSAAASGASAASPLKVVASFSILGDLVARVGGEHVALTTIVGPNGDGHVYEPTPQDARNAAAADLVVVNGLGFEGWLERLIDASGYKGEVATASAGVETIAGEDEHEVETAGSGGHHQGGVDPHAWQSIPNAVIYVKNIADALCTADAADCAAYRANAAAYTMDLTTLDARIRADVAAIPAERRKVITSHDAFGYFAKTYGIRFLAPEGVSTDSEASAADVARLIEQVRAERVTALFVENIADPRLLEQISRETGVAVGGALFSDALSEKEGPAPTYLAMMTHNIALLRGAMAGS